MSLSKNQRDVSAICDTACSGELLSGSQRARRLLKCVEHWEVAVPAGAAYRFGRGGAEVERAYTVRCGSASDGRAVELCLEVVAGSLPLLLGKKGIAKLGVTEPLRPEDLAKLQDDELPTYDLGVKSKGTASKCYVGGRVAAEPQGKLGQLDSREVGGKRTGPVESLVGEQKLEWPTPAEAVARPANANPDQKSARALRYERRRQRKKAATRDEDDGDEREAALLESESEKRQRQQEPKPNDSQGADAWGREKATDLAERGEKEAAQRKAAADEEDGPTGMSKRKKKRKLPRTAGLRGRRPKVLELTDRELRKIHEGSHRGLAALWHFLKSQVQRAARRIWKLEMSELRDRLKAIVGDCKKCNVHRRRQRGLQKVSERVEPNRRVWGDFMCLEKSQEIWAMVLVDESTAWGEGHVVPKPTAEKAWRLSGSGARGGALRESSSRTVAASSSRRSSRASAKRSGSGRGLRPELRRIRTGVLSG